MSWLDVLKACSLFPAWLVEEGLCSPAFGDLFSAYTLSRKEAPCTLQT